MTVLSTTPRYLQPGDRVADKYEVLRLMGRGAMGAVYEVEHVRTKKRFALKWMVPELLSSPEAVERFIREAQSACALEHPNVVQIFDVDQADGGMYSLMELLRGEPLSALLARGALSATELVPLVLPLLHGLQEAHERGVVHRDLKPENIFIATGRPGMPVRLKLLDFGLSKLLSHEKASQIRLTNTGMVMGTPAYMSPEQAMDAAVIDARADVYAVGAMLYEALTGHLPFEASSIPSLMLKVVQSPPKPLRALEPRIPASIEAVVLRCLAKKPEDRPQSAEELAFQLCDALGLSHDLYAPGGSSGALESLGPSRGWTDATEPAEGFALGSEPTHAATAVGSTPSVAAGAFDTAMDPTLVATPSKGTKRWVVAAVVIGGLVVGGALSWMLLADSPPPPPAVEDAEQAAATDTSDAPDSPPAVAAPTAEGTGPDATEPAAVATPEDEDGDVAALGAGEADETPATAEPPVRPARPSMRRRPRPTPMEEARTPMGTTPRLEVGMVAVDDF